MTATIYPLTQSEIMGAKFREGIRAAGNGRVPVVGDPDEDRRILSLAAAQGQLTTKDERPDYVEIDVADGLREIVLKRSDGTRISVHPQLLYGAAKKLKFYDRQMKKIQAEMDTCDDEEEMERLFQRGSEIEEKTIRVVIPDLPSGLLNSLDPGSITKLMETAKRMRGEVDEEDDRPNASQSVRLNS